jgi:hypothetical protein
MERAKRLELHVAKPETSDQSEVMKSDSSADTQLSTHAAEMAEIASAWPRLNREIQTAILTLVRVTLINTR